MYQIKDDWTGELIDVELVFDKYYANGRTAVQLWCDDGPYATLSVNLPNERCNEGEFYVDTNNCPWAEEFLEENRIAEWTGAIGFSGYCTYPLYALK